MSLQPIPVRQVSTPTSIRRRSTMNDDSDTITSPSPPSKRRLTSSHRDRLSILNLTSSPSTPSSPSSPLDSPIHFPVPISPDSYTKPCNSDSSAPPPAPLALPTRHPRRRPARFRCSPPAFLAASDQGDKYAKSRAVGQSHRDNERLFLQSLSASVKDLLAENILLHSLLLKQNELLHNLTFNDSLQTHSQLATFEREGIHSSMFFDTPEDFSLSERDALALGMFKVSAEASTQLGQRFISADMASALMEFVIVRWNIAAQQPDPSDGRKPLIRGRIFRACTTQCQALLSVQFARALLGQCCNASWISHQYALYRHTLQDNGVNQFDNNFLRIGLNIRLGSLGLLLERLDQSWLSSDLPGIHDDNEHMPNSPVGLDIVEFGHFHRTKLDGAKRCSRCLKLKTAGSGHGRSQCDDGFGISSTIPYRGHGLPPPIQAVNNCANIAN